MLAKKAMSRKAAKKALLTRHKPLVTLSQSLTLHSYVLPTPIGPLTVCLDTEGAVRWCGWLDKSSLNTTLAEVYPHHRIRLTPCDMMSSKEGSEEKENKGAALNKSIKDKPDALKMLWAYFTAPQETLSSTLQSYLDAIRVVMPPHTAPFTLLVRQTLRKEVPAGQVTTYGELALRAKAHSTQTNKEKKSSNSAHHPAARAVGQAMASNPVCVIVPCHRCLNAQHAVHGYGCGLNRKVWLLRHEKAPVDEAELKRYEHIRAKYA